MKTHPSPSHRRCPRLLDRFWQAAPWATTALWFSGLPLLCLLVSFWAVVYEGVQVAQQRKAALAARESALWRCKVMRPTARTACIAQLASVP